MKNTLSLLLGILLHPLFSGYDVGDKISLEHQNMVFDYCYPESQLGSSFSFAQHNGDLNGGDYQVLMIEISASWWPPCYTSIPEGDEIYTHWENVDHVAIIHFLYDINQPFSCSQWGDAGEGGIPPIVDLDVDEEEKIVLNWFNNPSGGGLGSLIVFFDHTLKIVNIMSSAPTFNVANAIIENMLIDFPELTQLNSPTRINKFSITRLYPNPFNPVLNIDFEINQAGLVKVNITDIKGSMVSSVYEGYMTVGKHQKSWNSENFPSGVYFVSLQAGGNSLTSKVVLLK